MSESSKQSGLHCLLVDDLPENLLALEALLKDEPVALLTARSGTEALELLLKHEVALALLDVQMPGMDGFELAELMRSTERTQRVPIIFLTAGSADRQRRFRGYEAGAVDFLHKPIEPDILRSKARVFFALAQQQRLLEQQRDDLQHYADALQAADRRKDEFLANMSHEIRTPMNAVVGLSNILAGSAPLTERQKDYIGTLQNSAQSLLSLINDLLDISKIESAPLELERTPFTMGALLTEVANMLQIRADEKNIALTLALDPALGSQCVVGDPARLKQVFLNLGSNAVKFTEQGSVEIGLAGTIDAARQCAMLRISVRDSGIGIAPDKLERIFDKFTQADSSINRLYGGTGLGLAITKTLSERMGGHIEVQSEPGAGSCFTVTLPLPLGEALPDPMPEPEAAPQKSPAEKRILLVEDHPTNILVAQTFLEEFGYEVEVANNGHEAVAKATGGAYRAVLMDVQMPGMDGYSATRAIRIHEAERQSTPQLIIGMTAHALMGDRERCIEAGMDDYLTKPFNPEELEHKLAVLERPGQ